jgi:hypothetical protein
MRSITIRSCQLISHLPRSCRPLCNLKVLHEGVHETDALDDGTGKVLAEDDGDLAQPGSRPDLRIPETEPVVPHATHRLEDDLRCDVDTAT